MNIPDVVTLIGLAIGTLGAIFLAYDVVYGPGRRFQASMLKQQLAALKSTRAFVQKCIRSLSQPPYTPAEIEKLLAEEEQESGPKEQALTKEADEFYDRYENRVVTLGATGVLLIVLSFALQFIGMFAKAS